MKKAGTPWGEAKKTTQNKVRWRCTVEALCTTANSNEYVKSGTGEQLQYGEM